MMEKHTHRGNGSSPRLEEMSADLLEFLRQQEPEQLEKIVSILKRLSSESRMKIFESFCLYCGDDDPSCQCWNDE